VKGILIVWKSSPFAGRRWNGGLGRSVYARNGSLPFRVSAPATMGCPLDAEEGNVCPREQLKKPRTHSSGINRCSLCLGTRPSLGPRTRARRSSLNSAGESRRRWRAERSIAVGQTRATGRNRHRGFVRRTMRGSPLVLALARGFTNAGQKRKEVAASVPARKREFRSECPHVAKAVCRNRIGGVRPRIRSRAAPSKRERGGSERGPSAGRASAVKRRRTRRAKRRQHVDPSR